MYKQRAAAAEASANGTASSAIVSGARYAQHAQTKQTSFGTASPPANPLFTLVNAATSLIDHKNTDTGSRPTTPVPADAAKTSSMRRPSSSVSSPTSVARPTHPSLFEQQIIASTSTTKRGASSPHPQKSFAQTLMSLLLDEEYSKIVTFLPDGNSWGIIHAKKFSDEVMPKVFGIRTFSSFVRKLHRWGFERVMEKKTHEVDVFRHDLFRQGDWASCAKIRCGGSRNNNNSNINGQGGGRPAELYARAVAVTQSRAALALSHQQQQHQQQHQQQQQHLLSLGLPAPMTSNMSVAAAALYQERRKSDPTVSMLRSAVTAAHHFAGRRRPSDATAVTTSHHHHHPSSSTLSDVTSKVVEEALATLRRDQNVASHHSALVQQQQQQVQQQVQRRQSFVQQQMLQDEMRKLEAQQQRVALLTSQFATTSSPTSSSSSSSSSSVSPRSSMGYYVAL